MSHSDAAEIGDWLKERRVGEVECVVPDPATMRVVLWYKEPTAQVICS